MKPLVKNLIFFISFPFIYISLLCYPLSAHPHQFIDNHITIAFDKNGIQGFKI